MSEQGNIWEHRLAVLTPDRLEELHCQLAAANERAAALAATVIYAKNAITVLMQGWEPQMEPIMRRLGDPSDCLRANDDLRRAARREALEGLKANAEWIWDGTTDNNARIIRAHVLDAALAALDAEEKGDAEWQDLNHILSNQNGNGGCVANTPSSN